jgi:hypothetical protein
VCAGEPCACVSRCLICAEARMITLEAEMNGQAVLRSVVSALESIDPEDRHCRFCHLLLGAIRPLLEKAPESGGLDDKVVEVVHEAGIRESDPTDPPGSILHEVVRLNSQR